MKIVIAYHSGYGHTEKVANAVAAGAKQTAGVTVSVLNVEQLKNEAGEYNFEELNAADAIIFGCPTYMGGPSAQYKTFIDAASKVWFSQGWKDKIAGGFTNSGSPSGDKQNTLTTLWVNAMQHGMLWVGTALMPAMTDDPNGPSGEEINRLGGFSGLMTASAQKAPLEQTPPAGDLKTAELFGTRIAEVTARLKKGS